MAGMYPELYDVISVDARPFNLRLPRNPELIFVPRTDKEICRILVEAKQKQKKVAVRCGGHSYAAYGLGGGDGAWVIDLQQFDSVVVEDDGKHARIGAGNRLGRVALQLDNAGKAIPHGLCPRVGVSGHALHGGFGFASRNWGLALDSIEELRVILPDGKGPIELKRDDTDQEKRDLFWSMLGAGSSFAICTELRVKLQDRPENCIHYWYTWETGRVLPPKETLIKVHQGFQTFCHQKTVPKELTVRMRILSNYMEMTGAFWGTREDFDKAIQPLLDLWSDAQVPPDQVKIRREAPLHASVHKRTWREMLLYMANDDHLEGPLSRQAMATLSLADYKLFFLDGLLDDWLERAETAKLNPDGITISDRLDQLEQSCNMAEGLKNDSESQADALREFIYEYKKSQSVVPEDAPMGFLGSARSTQPDPDFTELVEQSKSSINDEFLATSLCIEKEIASHDLFTYITEKPGPKGYKWFLLMDFYGGENSMIRQGRNNDHSCYSFRDYMFTFQFYINVDKDVSSKERAVWKEAIDFLHGMRDSVKKNTASDFKAYMCYIDPEDSLEKTDEGGIPRLIKPLPASYYYGAEQYEKLKANKRRFDPDFMLWNPQAIGAENIITPHAR